jgi:hypothetical protein
MVIIGIDAHKRSHTAVIVDTVGRQIAVKTIGTTSNDHLALLAWANKHDDQERLWAIEDCRHLSRRLESDLLAAGEQVVRVPPKLMSHVRDSARTFGKSDPIDALSMARAALREPDLPVARLDGAEREIRLLVDHREDLVAERTRFISRLRWHLHELDPAWAAPANFDRASAFARIKFHLDHFSGVVADLAQRLLTHLHHLTEEIDELTAQPPDTSHRSGTAGDRRLRILDRGENPGRDRRSHAVPLEGRLRTPQRHCPAAGVVVEQGPAPGLPHRKQTAERGAASDRAHPGPLPSGRARAPGPPESNGDGGMEALRILKRRLSDVVYRALIDDHKTFAASTPILAA